MIHRCATCPFWNRKEAKDVPIQELTTWGDCQVANGNSLSPPEVLMYVAKRFETSEAFGCVQHPMNKAIA